MNQTFESYKDLPNRITRRWLESLDDETLRQVSHCVDEEQDYWQDYSHARAISGRWQRVYEVMEERGLIKLRK